MHGYWILNDERIPIEVDLLTWARWLDREFADGHPRVIAQENTGAYWVSTVFLGLDHSWQPGPPLLFETMIFTRDRRESTDYQERTSTYELALEQHRIACKLASAGKLPTDEDETE